ncbi:MAG: hypothetical protein ACFB21_12420 [Opitutales bacterium]
MAEVSRYRLKENEAEARERMRAFWEKDAVDGRPPLRIIVDNPGYTAEPFAHPEMTAKECDRSPEWHAWRTRNELFGKRYLAESFPGILATYGANICLPSDLLGGDYEWHGPTTWTYPMPDVYERPLPSFDPANPIVRDLDRCIEAMAAVIGDNGFINPPSLLDPLTTLSLFRGMDEMCMDLVDDEEKVNRFCRHAREVALDSHRHFQAKVESLGYGENQTWLGTLAEGTMEAVQCDASIMLSPDMFEDFVLPDLAAFVEYFDRSLYHLDGNAQARAFDHMASLPKLDGIQWNPEPGGDDPRQQIELLREVRKRGWCLFVSLRNLDDAIFVIRELGPEGLFVDLPNIKTLDEAESAMETLQRVFCR